MYEMHPALLLKSGCDNHTAKGGAGASIATVESHSAEPLAPAPWELEEVAGELARSAHDVA
jgi:hypothetical protein